MKPSKVEIKQVTPHNFTDVPNKAIQPPPNGVYVICGANGIGKSNSILALLLPFMGQKPKHLSNPIKVGEKSAGLIAEAIFHYEDGSSQNITIEEYFTPSTHSLIVKDSNKQKLGGSKFIKEMVQLPSIQPDRFASMLPRTQAAEIIKLYGNPEDFEALNTALDQIAESLKHTEAQFAHYQREFAQYGNVGVAKDFQRIPDTQACQKAITDAEKLAIRHEYVTKGIVEKGEHLNELNAKSITDEEHYKIELAKAKQELDSVSSYCKHIGGFMKSQTFSHDSWIYQHIDKATEYAHQCEANYEQLSEQADIAKATYKNDTEALKEQIENGKQWLRENPLPSIEALRVKFNQEQDYGKRYANFHAAHQCRAKLDKWTKEVEDERQAKLDAQKSKQALIDQFDLPEMEDKRLVFDETQGLMLQDGDKLLPFNVAHTCLSDRILLSLALEMKNKPNCPVYYIEGSTLGESRMRQIDQLAKDNNVLLLIERATLNDNTPLFFGTVETFLNHQ